MGSLRAVLFRPLDRWTTGLCFLVVALNLVDVFATLRHLEHGASELNPVMAMVLRHGAEPFLVVKHVVASVAVFAIACVAGARGQRTLLGLVLPLYGALALYQIALFAVT